MKMFLVEGAVFRTYDDEDQERIEDTRLVMAESEINAIRKYEKWWEDQSEDHGPGGLSSESFKDEIV